MKKIEHLKEFFNAIYDRNPFVHLLEMKIISLREGEMEICMPVDPAKHTNLYNSLHGGAAAALADTAMGAACISMGNKVVTIDLNINYISNAGAGDVIHAYGKVVHCGRTTMVVEATLTDNAGKLIAKSRGTFMIIGKMDTCRETVS